MVVHYRKNLAGAEQTAAAIEQLGITAELLQADLCCAADRERLIEDVWAHLGRPTTWINNAGADVLTGEAAGLSFQAKLALLMETDVMATIELSRRVAGRMLADLGKDSQAANTRQASCSDAAPPSMTFIGWDQAPLGMEGDAGQMFGPVKAAVMSFANSLAQELAPKIRVNTIAPGWIKTAWGESTNEYWENRAKSQALMNRWGTPSDVAKAVCFVANPANTFCSGQTICVNGGWNRTDRR